MDAPRRLYRSESDRMLVGVCGGLGAYLRVDPVIVRVVFVLLTLAGGSGAVVYLVLAIVVPAEGRLDDPSRDTVRDNVEEIGVRAREIADDARSWADRADAPEPAPTGDEPETASAAPGSDPDPSPSVTRNRAIVGWLLVAVGTWFLLMELGLRLPTWLASLAWPLALIAIGVLLLVRRRP